MSNSCGPRAPWKAPVAGPHMCGARRRSWRCQRGRAAGYRAYEAAAHCSPKGRAGGGSIRSSSMHLAPCWRVEPLQHSAGQPQERPRGREPCDDPCTHLGTSADAHTRALPRMPVDACMQDEVLIAGFGRSGHAVGDIPGVRFKVCCGRPIAPPRHPIGNSGSSWPCLHAHHHVLAHEIIINDHGPLAHFSHGLSQGMRAEPAWLNLAQAHGGDGSGCIAHACAISMCTRFLLFDNLPPMSATTTHALPRVLTPPTLPHTPPPPPPLGPSAGRQGVGCFPAGPLQGQEGEAPFVKRLSSSSHSGAGGRHAAAAARARRGGAALLRRQAPPPCGAAGDSISGVGSGCRAAALAAPGKAAGRAPGGKARAAAGRRGRGACRVWQASAEEAGRRPCPCPAWWGWGPGLASAWPSLGGHRPSRMDAGDGL